MEEHAVEPLAVSVPKAAGAAGLSVPHLWREIALGKIASVKVGRRRLVMLKDLKAYLEARRSPASPLVLDPPSKGRHGSQGKKRRDSADEKCRTTKPPSGSREPSLESNVDEWIPPGCPQEPGEGA